MNRGHTIEEYLATISKLNNSQKKIKFSSDFIIAYPGETDEDFNETLLLMKKVKFINSYSFIFSPRPGTPSANLKEVDTKIAKERLSIFQTLASNIKKDYRKKLINSTAKVLFENKIKNEDNYFGRDEYFNSIIVNSKQNLTGLTKIIKIKRHNNNTLFGEIISEVNKEKDYAA
tara:strand:- start:454 stop:975 length:522 start_codon:yes stop_codon:yes gene_type:complete